MTYTSLRMGTPQFKRRFKERSAPLAVGLCVEPYVLAANVLNDPGFEINPELIFAESGGTLFGIGSGSGWIASVGDGTSTISTSNPRSGSKHLQVVHNSVGIPSSNNFYPIGGWTCIGGKLYTAKVESGDYVRFSMWHSKTGDLINQQVSLECLFYDATYPNTAVDFPFSDDAFVSNEGLEIAEMGTSYAQLENDIFVPSGAEYLVLSFAWSTTDNVNGHSGTFSFDDFELEVA